MFRIGNKEKLKSVAVAMFMIVSVIAVSTVVTSTTVTNNNAPASIDEVGSTDVLVMNFTITATNDTLIDSDGTGTYLIGSMDATVGDQLSDFVDSDNLYFYRNNTDGQFALWVENEGNDWYNETEDHLLINLSGSGSPSSPSLGSNIDNTSGENVTGILYNSTRGIGPNSSQYIRYDDIGPTDAYAVGDDIFVETDNNSCYKDEINAVTVQNTGTANTNDIASVTLWAESGTTPGFQPGSDTQLPHTSPANVTWDGDSWSLSGMSYAIGTGGSLSQTFYVAVNYTATASNYGVKMKIPTLSDVNSNGAYDAGDEGLFLASTNDTGNIVNSNTQTIGKLGVNYYEGTDAGPTDVLKNDPDTIKYGETVDLKIDGSKLDGTSGAPVTYYLYRPYYKRTGNPGAYTHELQWKTITAGGAPVSIVDDGSNTETISNVALDYCGMWVLDNGDPSDITTVDNDFAYFWVNWTSPYTIELSKDEIYYGKNESITITVTEGGATAPAWIDIVDDTGALVNNWHSWEEDGTLTVKGDAANFSAAGNYTVNVYFDEDATQIGYGTEGYSEDYGYTNPAITGTNYSELCGPWDPYEKNATSETIRVKTGVPDATVNSGNDTMYWGFDGEVNITIKGYDGENLTGVTLDIFVYNDNDEIVGSSAAPTHLDTVDNTNVDNGYIHISDSNWGVDSKAAGLDSSNGTWYAYISANLDSDAGADEYTEEWNVTVEFEVKSAPKGQFEWIDDDGALFTDDNNDGEIPRIPQWNNLPLTIKFKVLDEVANAFGDLASGECSSILECAENITISGDALFTGTVDTLPGYSAAFFNDPNWEIPIIPTMAVGGGEITIEIDAFNTTLTETLTIGGTNYGESGSVVEVTPNSFAIDQDDQTLFITIKNAETGVSNPYCTAYLYYLNDAGVPVEQTAAGVSTAYVGKATASGGEYSIVFNITQQTDNQTYVDFDGDVDESDTEIMAPRNLTVYVDGPGNRKGYALIEMTQVSDLEVELSHNTLIAGKQYDDFYINCTIAGNSTETPSEDDKDKFHIQILDEEGNDVTDDDILNGIDSNELTNDDDYIFDFNNVYATEPGTYTLYAYNNTHDSTGYNATLVVEQVTVECDKTPLIWGYDDNISATFTVTYNGEPINGSLIIDNVTKLDHDDGDYNATWKNTSFDGDNTFDGPNEGIEIDSDDLVNGVITIHDISAIHLDEDESSQNITFWFKPDSDDGVGKYARTMGLLPVSVPTVTPSPQYIAVGETTTVDVTVTGRDTLLNDIFVALNGRGVEQNGTSGADGIVTFSVLPTSSGNISIDVGEEGRTVDTVLIATNWVLDVSVSPDTVDEGDEFTVTVTEERSGDVVEGATVTINGIGSVDTDENGEATFTAPTVTSDRSFTIKASKEGYAPDDDIVTIFVTNIPQLVISADAKVQAGATFDVAVAKDTGDPVVGATITFDGEEYKTKAGGVATLTAPDKEGTYPITATFDDFVSAETTIEVTPGTPGFELLTLIAAIGVAFILLRRRRNK